MSHTETTSTPTGAGSVAPARDLRGFWRILLAVLAPVPMVAKGIFYLLFPADGGASFTDTVAAVTAHPTLSWNLRWLDLVFLATLAPAAVAVAWVTRRATPVLATLGTIITVGGVLVAGGGLSGSDTLPLLTAHYDLDPTAMEAAYDAVGGEPLFLITIVCFLLGIVVGLGLLGAALWRSHVVPKWFGIALMVGGITHPFIENRFVQGAGLLIAAAGFAGATVALLRMRNEEFDLPPTA
jgi:hypothetical protein